MKLDSIKYFVGVDISKDTLDICFLTIDETKKDFYKIKNNHTNIKALFDSFKFNEIAVCYEATNNYHIEFAKYLTNQKISYSEINAYKSSLFLKHLTHIKTDITDSYGLAYYCKHFGNTFIQSKFNSKYKLIQSYNSTYSIVVKMQTQLKNFEKSQISANDETLKQIIVNLKNIIKQTLKRLEDIAYELLKDEIPVTDEIINSNKGIGKSLALSLFPILHYNKNKSSKEIISYLGLSPRIYESGISVKKSQKINKIGNSNIRRILYLSALSCIRHNEVFKQRYERLLTNNKSKKVAIVAVMCAIIRYLKSRYFKDDIYK